MQNAEIVIVFVIVRSRRRRGNPDARIEKMRHMDRHVSHSAVPAHFDDSDLCKLLKGFVGLLCMTMSII